MIRQWIKAPWIGIAVLATMVGEAGAANWADGLFAERAHDFGPVVRGAIVRHPFVLTNRLAEPVTIVGIRASCGCTSGSASASVVPPGGRAVVEAQMDTRNFAGKKATVLFVTLATASGGEAEVNFAVQSMILSDVVLNPGSVDFGQVTRGQSSPQTLTIDRIGAEGWKIVRMVSASKVLDASLVETSRANGAVNYALTVSIKPDAPAGVIRDDTRLIGNDPGVVSIPVPVSALVRGELSASPGVLALGHVPAAGQAQGRFIVRGPKPFAITGVEGGGDGFQVAPVDPGKKAALHVLNVSYKAGDGTTRGDLRHAFRVKTDLPGEAPVDVTATLRLEP